MPRSRMTRTPTSVLMHCCVYCFGSGQRRVTQVLVDQNIIQFPVIQDSHIICSLMDLRKGQSAKRGHLPYPSESFSISLIFNFQCKSCFIMLKKCVLWFYTKDLIVYNIKNVFWNIVREFFNAYLNFLLNPFSYCLELVF